MKALKSLSFLNYRYRAEDAAASLPGLIAHAEKSATSVFSGEHAQRKPGQGEKFWQYREYNISDRPQDIDWRQSAKGDRIFVKEREWQTAQTAMIWCQNNTNMDYHSDDRLSKKQDAAMILSLAFGILLTRSGEQIAALEGSGIPGRSEASLQKLGEHLVRNKTGALPSRTTRKIPKRSSLILVGDFLSPFDEIKTAIDILAEQAQNVVLLQVLDPAELALPFEGRVIFEQSGAGDHFPVDNVETIRDAYNERIKDHMEKIFHYCKRHGWHWLLHRTDQEITATLFDAWLMISPESYHSGASR